MWILRSIAFFATMALITALAQPSRADVTLKSQDGQLELTLPNGWHPAKKAGGENTAILAAGHGTRIAVRQHSKEDFKDLKAVANFLASKLQKKITDAEPKFQDIQVNGKPAVVVELEGTEPNGVKKGYIVTVLDTDAMYISITASGKSAAFAREKQVLSGLPNQLKVMAASSTPPSAEPQPSATSTPTATPKPAKR